jgi:hypothetical protein
MGGLNHRSAACRSAVVRQRIRHHSVKFATAGYYRIKATGPDGSVGWVTVDVGVNPNTAP